MKGTDLQLLVCSANLGNEQPDKASIAAWIPPDGLCTNVLKYPAKYPLRNQFSTFDEYDENDRFDIIVIGMQEATFEQQQESSLDNNTSLHKSNIAVKKTIANLTSYVASRDHTKKPKKSNYFGSASSSVDSSREAVAVDEWDLGTSILHQLLEERLPSYTRQVSFQRGQMRLEVFVRTEQIQVEVLHVKAQNTGRAGLANKGGIVTELLVNQRTRIAFLTAHLEAHEGVAKYQQRCSSLGDILGGTRGGKSLHDVSMTAHYCFVMGDLNFRSDLEDPSLDEVTHKRKVKEIVIKQDWDQLNAVDELHKALKRKDCLVGFQTPLCNFPPTFKMERCKGYTYITKRRPSYTDRILYKTGPQLEAHLRSYVYEPIDDFASSDHKPVRAAYSIRLNTPLQMRAKMARRRSAMQMAGDFFQGSAGMVVSHKERLHIFLNSMSCMLMDRGRSVLLGNNGGNQDIHQNGTNGSGGNTVAPSPYICLVTTPEEAVRKFRTRWDRWKVHLPFVSVEETGTTAHGWPQTSIQKNTSQPDWEEEELHTEIRTYQSDGSPLDLTGAMLRFTVMDANDDSVLGSSCYNLGHLVRTFRPASEARARQQQQQPPAAARGRGRRGSILNMFRRGDESSRGFGMPDRRNNNNNQNDNSESGEDPVKSIPIDVPLVKNGMETGRIRFTMDVWWMNESTARALLGDKQQTFKLRKSNKSDNDPLESAVGVMGSSHMFSQRRDPHEMRRSAKPRRR